MMSVKNRVLTSSFTLIMRNIPKLFKKLQFLGKIDIKWINVLGTRHTVGRIGYGKSTMMNYLLVQKIVHCSDRDLEEISGYDHSTFSKARKRFKRDHIYEKFFSHLIKLAIRKGVLQTEKILIDSSFVKTYSGKKEEGSSYWIKGIVKKGYGFKLHALTDEQGIPLALIITTGSRHDCPVAIPLLESFRTLRLTTKYVLADKGYDDLDLVHYIVTQLGAKAGIPMRVKQGKKTKRTNKQGYQDFLIKSKGRWLRKSVYNKRSQIERSFSKLKNKFNLGKERMRGMNNFIRNCYLSCICYLLTFLYAHGISSF